MTDAEALAFARAALRHWGSVGTPRLIKNRENAVFETVTADGTRAALRLHRPGYQSADSIRSELWWAEALVAAGLQVPVPVHTVARDILVEVPEAGRMASMVTWVSGTPMGEGDVPLAGTGAQQEAWHFALGQELARLHFASDSAVLPAAFTRPVLNTEALVGDSPAWGRFWENAALTADDVSILQEARARIRQILEARKAPDFGLIHADALRENVMLSEGRATLIDFDDGVFGYRMYELGVALSQNWDQANRDALAAALLAGYASVRALPDGAADSIEAFVVMRTLASCGWVIARYAPDAPETRSYANRAVVVARRWMGR